jgi:hypothetical protein
MLVIREKRERERVGEGGGHVNRKKKDNKDEKAFFLERTDFVSDNGVWERIKPIRCINFHQ